MTIQWLFKELTASFQGYSYYYALPDQMQSRATARPRNFQLAAKALPRRNHMWLSLFKSYGSPIELWLIQELQLKDLMQSLLELQLQPKKLPVSSQSTTETEPYVVVSYRAMACLRASAQRSNEISFIEHGSNLESSG